MSRSISVALASALTQEVTNLCHIWRLTLTGGTTLYYTDLDSSLLFSGNVYSPDPGMRVSAVKQTIAGGTQNATIDFAFSEFTLTEADVRGGKLDNATFELSIIDWSAPDTRGELKLIAGRVTDISFTDKGTCNITITGKLNSSNVSGAEYYSKTCRASLGDARCTKDLTPWTVSGAVTDVDSLSTSKFSSLDVDGLQVDNFYSYGTILWNSGLNAGRTDEINTYVSSTGTMTLTVSPAFAIQIGDTFTLKPGCDKQVSTCKNKYNNLVNFRGEALAPPPGLTPLSLWQNPQSQSTTQTYYRD